MSSVILGTDMETEEVVRIGDIERRSGLYLLGRMGMGKSALATNIALGDIVNGHGLFFIDPAGDAVNDLLCRGDAQKLKDTAHLFDIEDDDYSFGINLLTCDNINSLRSRTAAYSRAYNVFYKSWEENWGVWLQLILENVLWAFIENPGYSLADVPMFLNPRNVDFREHIISNIRYNTPVADFWRYEFFDSKRREQTQQERIDAALTRLNTLLNHPYVRDIVGQAKTTIDFANVLSTNKVILLKLSANLPEDVKKFVGTILLNELVHAVRDRPEDMRTQFCVFIDEFHNFASSDHMATLSTEGRKYGTASTYIHVERFGQLVNNQKLMGATAAIVNKGLFQQTVKDAEEFAPEFAKKVEATEIHREAELVLSPSPVEDIWDRGHPHEYIMWLRGRYFWIVELLRNYPNKKYFVFDPSWTPPEYRSIKPLTFQMQDFTDWDYFCSSADMIRQAISLWNQFLFDWMRGKYDPDEIITDEQVEITIKMIECLGGVLGFLPMLRPYIPPEKRERLLYLMNEKRKQNYEDEKRVKIQTARTEMQYLKEHPIPMDKNGITHDILIKRGFYKCKTKLGQDMIFKELVNELTRDKVEEKTQRIESLWNQIQTLEYSQPYQYTSLPSSITSLKNLDEIKTVAIQAGMPSHELEEFIEWELNPFTSEEREALDKYVRFATRMVNDVFNHEDRDKAHKIYLDEYPKAIDQFFNALTKRRSISDSSSRIEDIRLNWQRNELLALIELFLGDKPRILANDPIKIPSGKYIETLKVDRPQHDLVTDMVLELSNLPRYQAYIKLIDKDGEKQVVRTHKIQTHPLPKIQNPGMIDQALINGHTLGKKRDEIDAEIRARQNRWGRGGSPPQTKRLQD